MLRRIAIWFGALSLSFVALADDLPVMDITGLPEATLVWRGEVEGTEGWYGGRWGFEHIESISQMEFFTAYAPWHRSGQKIDTDLLVIRKFKLGRDVVSMSELQVRLPSEIQRVTTSTTAVFAMLETPAEHDNATGGTGFVRVALDGSIEKSSVWARQCRDQRDVFLADDGRTLMVCSVEVDGTRSIAVAEYDGLELQREYSAPIHHFTTAQGTPAGWQIAGWKQSKPSVCTDLPERFCYHPPVEAQFFEIKDHSVREVVLERFEAHGIVFPDSPIESYAAIVPLDGRLADFDLAASKPWVRAIRTWGSGERADVFIAERPGQPFSMLRTPLTGTHFVWTTSGGLVVGGAGAEGCEPPYGLLGVSNDGTPLWFQLAGDCPARFVDLLGTDDVMVVSGPDGPQARATFSIYRAPAVGP